MVVIYEGFMIEEAITGSDPYVRGAKVSKPSKGQM